MGFLILVLVALWLMGFAFHILGGFIHALLVIAFILVLIKLFRSNK
jgi:hypothetical protein